MKDLEIVDESKDQNDGSPSPANDHNQSDDNTQTLLERKGLFQSDDSAERDQNGGRRIDQSNVDGRGRFASPVHPRATNEHAKKAQDDVLWPSLEGAFSFSPEFIARNDGQNQARQGPTPQCQNMGADDAGCDSGNSVVHRPHGRGEPQQSLRQFQARVCVCQTDAKRCSNAALVSSKALGML